MWVLQRALLFGRTHETSSKFFSLMDNFLAFLHRRSEIRSSAAERLLTLDFFRMMAKIDKADARSCICTNLKIALRLKLVFFCTVDQMNTKSLIFVKTWIIFALLLIWETKRNSQPKVLRAAQVFCWFFMKSWRLVGLQLNFPWASDYDEAV